MRVDYYMPPVPLQQVRHHARVADTLGFDGFITAETSRDPFAPLTVAALEAPRLELGTGIAVAFARSPMVVAHTAWDLAEASGGKFMLGLGTQVRAHIVRRFSMEWGPPGPRLREYVSALRAIWHSWQHGSPLRFEGEHYRFSLMPPFFDPGPITTSQPAVFIAGVGPYLTRLAGELCNGLHVHPFHTVRYLDEVTLPAIAAGAAAAGRDAAEVELSAAVFVATGRTPEQVAEARNALRAQIAFYASTPSYRPLLELHGWDFGPRLSALARRGEWGALGNLIGEEVVDAVAVSGPPGELGERLRERYRGRLDRIGFYGAGPGLTAGLDDADWEDIISSLRG